MPTIIAIGAHHDDVELRSGGTLARYAMEGWHVVYAVATTTPHYLPWPEEKAQGQYRSNAEIIELRKEESRRGAAVLRIKDVHFFDFKSMYWYKDGTHKRRYLDGHNSTMEEFRHLNQDLPGREFIMTACHCSAAVDFLCNFLQKKQADVVLTHFPDDAHWEHYATAGLVRAAVRRWTGAGRRPKLYAWEQGGAGNMTSSFAPTHFVDITSTIDLKCESLMSFVSQFGDHNPQMFADRARRRAQAYGKMTGMQYAEPYMLFQIPSVSMMNVYTAPTYDVSQARHGL